MLESSIASAQAAKTALRTVITPLRARELAAAHAAALPDLRAHVAALLVEGVLSEDYVLQARTARTVGIRGPC
jgi:hypothetical protein